MPGRRSLRIAAASAISFAGLFAFVLFVAPGRGATPAVPNFRHALVIVFENEEEGAIIGNPAAPTFAELERRYAPMTAYTAVAHPSLPNYLALVSGSTQGIDSDCTSCLVHSRSLADTLDRAGLTWKTYAEGLPRPGFNRPSSGLYAKKHDPFLYFADIAENPRRRAHVVPLAQLRPDLAAGRLPRLALIVPNLCNDMHDCSVATGDRWLRRTIVPLLAAVQLANSVVFVVFDEGSTSLGGGGHVAALVLGLLVRPGSRYTRPTNHYSLFTHSRRGLAPAATRPLRRRPADHRHLALYDRPGRTACAAVVAPAPRRGRSGRGAASHGYFIRACCTAPMRTVRDAA